MYDFFKNGFNTFVKIEGEKVKKLFCHFIYMVISFKLALIFFLMNKIIL